MSSRSSKSVSDADAVQCHLRLTPGPENPRNSEGAFISLKDGRLLFIYTHFVEGAGDHAQAYLASRCSTDGGETWSDRDEIVLLNEEAGMNVMSVSLLRRADDAIALFYCRKNSTEDCRPRMRISTDEARTWSEPIDIIPDDEVGYYVLNNDRVIQLQHAPHARRLVVPVALHNAPAWPEWTKNAQAMCYLSDDSGRTWRRSADVLDPPQDGEGESIALQEPGVVELTDGRLMMFIRTDGGYQYLSYSSDGGEHWSAPVASLLASPTSPASIKRIPGTGDLLLVWNDHAAIDEQRAGRRTPLSAAISHDDGKAWEQRKILFDDPDGWYCYTAIHFEGDRVLLGHVAGRAESGQRLNTTEITGLEVDWLYQ